MYRRFCHVARVLRALFAEWRNRARSRAEIATLHGCTIRDLGLSRSQLHFEAEKPFWRS